MVTLTIEGLAYGGDAIAHLDDGRAAFVTGACPGDRVAAEVTEERERFVRARVVDVLDASPVRVEPLCRYFGICGGCQWQHVSYDAQLIAKRQAVVDALGRIGHLADAAERVAAAVPSPDAYGYRNKVELVADPGARRLTLGYHRAGSEEVVPVEECLLLPKRLAKAPKALTGALRYVAGERDLQIARVGLRAARHTKDVEVALWTPPGPFPRSVAARALGQALPLSSLVRVLYKGELRERAVTKVEVLSGKGHWRERIAGLDMAVSAPSFFQTNTRVAEQLVEIVLGAVEPDGSDRVADLFAGAGTFTLPLSEKAGEVIAVESAGSAVRDLRRNLDTNGVFAQVVGGDAAREAQTLGRFDAVVVDPPRSGLGPRLTGALPGMRPRVLVYVSCDPATLARDAAQLATAGYALRSATPVDLFPHTFHVEAVAVFEPQRD